MRRRQERGAGLLLGMLAVVVVIGALSQVATNLARQARIVRTLRAREVTVDLVQSARTWAADRLTIEPGWTGPDRIELDTGTVEVSRVDGGQLRFIVELTGQRGTPTVDAEP